MATVLLLLFSFLLIGLALMMMSAKKIGRIFRFTAVDQYRTEHVFLVESDDLEGARLEANKILILYRSDVLLIEELDPETWSVIDTPYTKPERDRVMVKMIK